MWAQHLVPLLLPQSQFTHLLWLTHVSLSLSRGNITKENESRNCFWKLKGNFKMLVLECTPLRWQSKVAKSWLVLQVRALVLPCNSMFKGTRFHFIYVINTVFWEADTLLAPFYICQNWGSGKLDSFPQHSSVWTKATFLVLLSRKSVQSECIFFFFLNSSSKSHIFPARQWNPQWRWWQQW